MNQGNNNNKNRGSKGSKYAHLKHKHVPRIFQNNMPAFFDVYTPDCDAVYTVAASDIIHLPNDYQEHYSKGHNQHNNHRLILCPNFHKNLPHHQHHHHHEENEVKNGFCPQGDQCSNVHAYLDNARVNNDIHVNFAYKNLQEVKYQRYKCDGDAADPTATSLRIAPPNETSPVEDLPAHLCIRTNAYIGRDRITSHCAHYFYNRVCLRGTKCFFVHAVSLEPVSSSKNNVVVQDLSDENKINRHNQDQGCDFHVDPKYRRIYGRTETLRRQNNNNNQDHQQTQGRNIIKQQRKQQHCQSFASSASYSSQNQQQHQQNITMMTKKNSFTGSSASASSSHHDEFGDEEEHDEETMMMTTEEHAYHYDQHQEDQTSSSMTGTTPRMLCQGCRKFVHNPYSWTQTTVCLARTSPSASSSSASSSPVSPMTPSTN